MSEEKGIRSIWYGDTYQCEQCGEICHVPLGCNGPTTQDIQYESFFRSHKDCDRPQTRELEKEYSL